MIYEKDGLFVLETAHTTYSFRVMETGQLEHLYYGKKIHVNPEALAEKHAFAMGNGISYDSEHQAIALEDLLLEYSGLGKGDVRDPMIEIVHHDGNRTTDFKYQSYKVKAGKPAFKTLPGSIGIEGKVEHLTVELVEPVYSLSLQLHYYVFQDCDIITRSATLKNGGEEPIQVERLLSMQLDFMGGQYALSTFTGLWTNEMNRTVTPIVSGTYVNGSLTGTSSNRANPFIMLSNMDTTEDYGSCYGFNLIYSGNHYEAVQVSAMGKVRLVSGINPTGFRYLLEADEILEAPEAVMTYSPEGFSGVSQNMHEFVKEHIVRGNWKNKPRPVLLNSWEANYFKLSERSLLRLAKSAKDIGIELFVVDDGWFGERDDDTKSLGDWTPNEKKLPGGLGGLGDKINEMGMSFGIWVEPEMVNVNSQLYEAHPDWTLAVPDQPHSEGRQQRYLDLTNPDVQEYVIEAMTNVFESANIEYVKWDMNRIMSDVFSANLPAERMGEAGHRYMCGLYHVLQVLNQRFPNILFEGCASGGNRFDLGMLCYFPQIWASDNSDAYSRAVIQNGYSYGYPQSVFTCHVSDCPNHQTLRVTPLHTRFNVAAFGLLGYECNLTDLPRSVIKEMTEEIKLYKEWRDVFQQGKFYRIKDFNNGDITSWCIVSPDQKRAVGLLMQGIAKAQLPSQVFRAKGLNPNKAYEFYSIPFDLDIRDFGSLINMESPIHIRPGSLVHHAASNLINMPSEEEKVTVYGDLLMENGVQLKQPFRSTGYNEDTRLWKDFESRMYFMEMVD